MTGPAVNEVNEVGARTAAADVPAFCSLPWREILLDELLGERPLDEQAAVFRLYFVAWGAAGRLPAEPLRAALRAGIGLAPLSTLDVARFTALLDVIAPLTETGRAVAGPFQVWVHRAVTGWAGKKLQTEKARDAKARKASAATQRTEPVIELLQSSYTLTLTYNYQTAKLARQKRRGTATEYLAGTAQGHARSDSRRRQLHARPCSPVLAALAPTVPGARPGGLCGCLGQFATLAGRSLSLRRKRCATLCAVCRAA